MANQTIREQILEVLSDPMNLPSVFWDYATQSWLKDAPVFPISQVFGFTLQQAQAARVATSEATTATAYGDLTTVGPTLPNLADGRYIVFFGAVALTTGAGASAIMSVKQNSTEATDTDATYTAATSGTSISSALTASLSNSGSNTLTCRYKNNVVGQTATFASRWMVALRYGNL